MEKNKTVPYIVKYDSILREEPSLSSNCLTILIPKTKLEYLNESKEENNGEKYDKVKIIKNDNYPNELIGWILHKQIIEYKPSLSIETKNKSTRVSERGEWGDNSMGYYSLFWKY